MRTENDEIADSHDSFQAKQARLVMWQQLWTKFGPGFYKGKHLVLATKSGGHISMLLSLRVYAKDIVVVDMNGEAAVLALERFPGTTTICGDVRDVLKEYRRQFTSIFLDFESVVDADHLDTIELAMKIGLRDKAAIGFSFKGGTDAPFIREAIGNRLKSYEDFLLLSDDALVTRWMGELDKDRDADSIRWAQDILRKPAGFVVLADQIRLELQGTLSIDSPYGAHVRGSAIMFHLLKRTVPFNCGAWPLSTTFFLAKGAAPSWMTMCLFCRASSASQFKKRFSKETGYDDEPELGYIQEGGEQSKTKTALKSWFTQPRSEEKQKQLVESMCLAFNITEEKLREWLEETV